MLTKEDLVGQGWQKRQPNYKPKGNAVENMKVSQQQEFQSPFNTDTQGSKAIGGGGGQKLPMTDRVYVHYIPHSHTDLGWVNTVDEYFAGVKMGNYNNKVHDIIETSI